MQLECEAIKLFDLIMSNIQLSLKDMKVWRFDYIMDWKLATQEVDFFKEFKPRDNIY